MLHRDVKSSNVLLDAPPGAGRPVRARLSDVGLARAEHGATMTAGVGTLGYMDPGYFATGERASERGGVGRERGYMDHRDGYFATGERPSRAAGALRTRRLPAAEVRTRARAPRSSEAAAPPSPSSPPSLLSLPHQG